MPTQWSLTDHDATQIGLWVSIFAVVMIPLTVDKSRSWILNNLSSRLTYSQLPIFVGYIIVLVVLATAIMHLLDDRFKGWFHIIPILCIPSALLISYMLFSLRIVDRINILAWQGWELLDGHIGSVPGWPGVRFKALYYSRGISSSTELYDSNKSPFEIIILDIERLLAISDQTTENLRVLPASIPRRYPEILQRILRTNETQFTIARKKYGVPARFGFNEILYCKNIDNYFQSTDGTYSLQKLDIAGVQRWASNQGKQIRLIFWDWSLPTLSTLLCAYKIRELNAKPGRADTDYLLSDVYKLTADEVKSLCAEIRKDLKAFNGPKHRVSQAEQLQQFIMKDNDEVCDIIIGFGSMAVSKTEENLAALIPREGVLTWVEFVSSIDVKTRPDLGRHKRAEEAINKVILSLPTQSRLLWREAPRGLPATAEAYGLCSQRRPVPLILATAEELNSNPNIPLVMRRLPGDPNAKSTPTGAATREVWEEEWASIRKELTANPGST